MLLLLTLLMICCLPKSLQGQTPPPGRCDIPQRMDIHSTCTSCAAITTANCPHGFSRATTTNCSYEVQIGSRQMALSGCQHVCVKQFMQPQCCPQHWGPLCLPCPSWSGNTCNLHGVCMDGDTGNGTCVCDDGFSGFACQECVNPNAFGEKCDKECDCEHGVCNKGPQGDGQCWCQPPYSGPKCDQVSFRCSDCKAYSYCKGEADSATCECLPGHRQMASGNCANTCSLSDCDANAQCTSKGSKVTCACNPGYEGDGRICVPINPCSKNNGGCPLNSTICVFKGPNKSSCKCMYGMSPIGGNPESGCELVSACSADTCDSTAVCQTGLDGQPRCECEAVQIGDGRRCYGNLMERILELGRSKSLREDLTQAVDLFAKRCALLLSHDGTFTLFLPVMRTTPTGVDEETVCKVHLILGQHLIKDLEGRDVNMYGGAKWRSKGEKKFILMDNPSRLYTVLQADLPAANGIIHIIDQPVLITPTDRSPRNEQFADKTIGEILAKDNKYNRFLSLVDNCGSPPPLRGAGPLTVFVPTNDAVDRARDGSILYMINDAKHKLQELLRHHIFSTAVLSVDDLAILPKIVTMANQVISITVSDDGQILLGEKGIHLVTTNIVASNGIIHMIDGLLFPPSILPILPHRCDVVKSKITVGPCVPCSYLYETDCPAGSIELETHLVGCYNPLPLNLTSIKGCAKYCNTTNMRAECCKGFYGPDCKPCIGGFKTPCYTKGTCLDGIQGNGSCSCQAGFKGVACHICSNPDKHGEKCDEDCHCVHGECDNRPGSRGVCRRGSCLEGFSGEYCDKRATPCNSDGLEQHCHIHAYCTQTGLNTVCVCRDGYEGNGHSCSPVNLCLKSNNGGCDINAECVYAGPGNVSCVCNEGWTGDGRVCVEINNCQLPSRGGCSPNANCTHVGPGQSECVCKTGYKGSGVVCDLVNPCLENNGGCSPDATCNNYKPGERLCSCKEGFKGNGTWCLPVNTCWIHKCHELARCEPTGCVCPSGFGGNGTICYGSLLRELEENENLSEFYKLTQKSNILKRFFESLRGNVTLLVPLNRAVYYQPHQLPFWTTRHHLPHLLRAHILRGIYSIEDLRRLVGSKVPTLNPLTYWEVRNITGTITVGKAPVYKELPATNGYFYVTNTVMIPPQSDLPPEPPTLMDLLNSSSNFTLFRQYALTHNLSKTLGAKDYTLLIPTENAIREHLTETSSSILELDVMNYHVIPNELLYPDFLSDATLKSTLLGQDYQVHFHFNDKNQTFVNDVPLDGSFTETQYGVIMMIPQVLKPRRNRCSRPVILQVEGLCTDCDGPPKCNSTGTPIRSEFPPRMHPNCKYNSRVLSRNKWVDGCTIKCVTETRDISCCPGYFGHECFKCPGDVGSWCSNHGECQDGIFGNGECRCYEGFHGTACEDCEPGRYGVNCSSECVCDHGKCDDGLRGSGRCVCYKGWKGASCSTEIKDDACGGVCDENANCITGLQGAAAMCVCTAGYEGNGTYCKELDMCSIHNGGCSEFAVCVKLSAGERSCTCKEGYTGDGVVCLEIDGCQVNNGGCHKFAECIRAGPNITACKCHLGFIGSGRHCFPVNPCLRGNGGCSKYARCQFSSGQLNCTCLVNFVGDGYDCRGKVSKEISQKPENSFFQEMIQLSQSLDGSPESQRSSTIGFQRPVFDNGEFTVFVPLSETNNMSTVKDWQSSGRLLDLIYYHGVSCEVLPIIGLKLLDQAVSISGHTLSFSHQQGSVWINNSSRIVKSDYTVANGVIHHIDKLLTPYMLQDKPRLEYNKMDFTEAAQVYGYSRFYTLVEDAGLLPMIQLSILQPFTMFWPTDQAINSLSAERKRWLSSPDHVDELASIIKAHMIRNTKVLSMAVSKGLRFMSLDSMHGSTIRYRCDRTVVGSIMINDNAAKVVERHLHFKEGIAYGIDQLLEPPDLGARCDNIGNMTRNGRCGNCLSPPPCPDKHFDTDKTERCSSYGGYGRWYARRSSLYGRQCQRVCQYTTWVKKCCKNHYGRDCQVCPGGVESPCNNHGVCDDGVSGSGTCRCSQGFRGRGCGRCFSGYFGPNCTACQCGKQAYCDDGIEGSGKCDCRPGWEGDNCQNKIGSVPEGCRKCHAQADCVQGQCLCKAGFEGNGTTCSALPPPDLCSKYNGGCHQNANCTQTGLVVNCTCQSDYDGDGFDCDPINRCVKEVNGGCSDFASCKFTGANQRECECLPGYVGNGVQCLEKVVPPSDRCLTDNGNCHPVAICKDLHYHAKTAGVYHLRSPEGKYKMNYSQAIAACQADGATLVTFKQLGDAQQMGMHLCVAGWIDGGKVGYPTRFPSVKCGDNHVGLVIYKDPVDQSSKYDAYCYRTADVSCSCPDGYIGDGDFCNGVLTDVLATYSSVSTFYKLLLDYSASAPGGKQIVDFLSHRTSKATLFVPHDKGFKPNQTLSARDLEYHITANHSRAFKDLRHEEPIASWLGVNLTVTHGENETYKMVDKQLLLEWDIPAVNGIIHVIQAPLTAPPPSIYHDSVGHAYTAGTVSAILVSLLLACVLAVLGYYIFKHKSDAFRFHYFRNEDEDGSAGGHSKPTLVSIPNPLYSGSKAFSEPFGDNPQELQPREPEEPEKILDLDQ